MITRSFHSAAASPVWKEHSSSVKHGMSLAATTALARIDIVYFRLALQREVWTCACVLKGGKGCEGVIG